MSQQKKTKTKKKAGGGNRGKKLGASVGSYLGGLLGGAAHKWFKGITGLGDYDVVTGEGVNANSLTQPLNRDVQVPFMHPNDHMGAVRITRREFVRWINTTDIFQDNVFFINPLDGATFPWLSNIASSFQQYILLGMVVEYVPTTFDGPVLAGASNASGSVGISVRYDVNSAPSGNMFHILNRFQSVSGRPSKGIIAPVECDPRITKPMPLNMLPEKDDVGQELIDGNTFAIIEVGTVGAPNPSANAGQLWISYDILLLKPQDASNVGRKDGGRGFDDDPEEKPLWQPSFVDLRFLQEHFPKLDPYSDEAKAKCRDRLRPTVLVRDTRR